MKSRTDLINFLISKNKYTSYLEIGVRNTYQNFDQIQCDYKIGVDPNLLSGHIQYNITSDEFFKNNTEHFDIIFIDGLHLEYQVYKDILNALKFLNPGGTIVCHDMNPLQYEHQVENYVEGKPWNGTCWKAWVRLRLTDPKLKLKVVDIDSGCGVIQESIVNQRLYGLGVFRPKYFTFEYLNSHRKELLNLVSVEEFINTYDEN